MCKPLYLTLILFTVAFAHCFGQDFTVSATSATAYGLPDDYLRPRINVVNNLGKDFDMVVVTLYKSIPAGMECGLDALGSYDVIRDSIVRPLLYQDQAGNYLSILTDPHGLTGTVTVKFMIYRKGYRQYRDTLTFTSIICSPKPALSLNASGTIVKCPGDSIHLTAPTGYPIYLWRDGSKAASRWVIDTGLYYVSAYPGNSCPLRSNAVHVLNKVAAPPTVCVVSVDSLTGRNVVVWEKPSHAYVQFYNVYRETTIKDSFDLIGTVSTDSLSIFEDRLSNPSVHSDRYRISATDVCGTETDRSPAHKTVHLSVSAGQNGWNLAWEGYEGFNVQTYNIYRGSSTGKLSFLTSVQSSLSSYSDLNPPMGTLFYVVEAANPLGCSPSRSSSYTYSRSNVASSDKSSIVEYPAQELVSVYPNPSRDGVLNITGHNSGAIVYGLLGQKVTEVRGEVHRLSLAPGTYILEVSTIHGPVHVRVMVK